MRTFEGRWPSVYEILLAYATFFIIELVKIKIPVITSTAWYYILLLFAGLGVAATIATLRGIISGVVARIRFCFLYFLVRRVVTLVAQGDFAKAKHEAALLKVKFRDLGLRVDLENLETDRARELLAELRGCTSRWSGLLIANAKFGRGGE